MAEGEAQRPRRQFKRLPAEVTAIIRSAPPFCTIRPLGEFDEPERVVLLPAD